MKNRIHFLAFLGIFILIIIPKNVYASERLPYQAIVNNTFFIAENYSNGNTISTTINGNSTYDFSINITTFVSPTYSIENGIDFVNYPYVWLFFEMYNAPEQITITRNATCNTSCFNGNNMVLKQIGVNPSNNRRRYVLILPILKYQVPSGNNNLGDGEMYLADVIRFENLSSNDRKFAITNILLSDSVNVDENVSYDDIINNATTNTNNMINAINSLNSAMGTVNNSINSMKDALKGSTDAVKNSTDSLNNTMKDESGVSNNDVSNKTTEWSNKLAGTGPVSQMVLMPITLLNGYVSGMNATCQPYNLGSLMGTDIIFPCVNVSNYLGATLWNVIDVLFSGFMIFAMGKKFVKIFNDFTNLRDNQMDELYGGGK